MSAMIAFFSRADENDFSGILRCVEVGNPELVAEMPQRPTGADLFKIEPIQPYSRDDNACVTEAQDNQRRNTRPELKAYPDSLSGYDTIYLGYPNDWGTMPMAVFPFLERFDFTGKTIKPFRAHEGSGMGYREADIRRSCSGAAVEKGPAIHGGSATKAGPALENGCNKPPRKKIVKDPQTVTQSAGLFKAMEVSPRGPCLLVASLYQITWYSFKSFSISVPLTFSSTFFTASFSLKPRFISVSGLPSRI